MNVYDQQRDHFIEKLVGVEQRRRREARRSEISISKALLDMSTPRVAGGPDRDLTGALRDAPFMLAGNSLAGREAEFFQEQAKLAGVPYDEHRAVVPWQELAQRDITVAASGAYLVGTDTLPAADILRPWSIAVQGGINVMEGLRGSAALPTVSGKSTVAWMANEGSSATSSAPTFASSTVTPKIAIGVVNISRQLLAQSNAEAVVRRELLRTAGEIIDTAVLNGSGSNGEPKGVLGVTGIGSLSGANLAWTGSAGVLHMKELASAANAQDSSIAFISTPAVREILEGRERAAGSGFIWQDNAIASCSAYATSDMPSATMLCGPMSQVTLALWGTGLSIELNPYDPTLFKSGVVQARIIVACDVAITCALTAFTKSTSIT